MNGKSFTKTQITFFLGSIFSPSSLKTNCLLSGHSILHLKSLITCCWGKQPAKVEGKASYKGRNKRPVQPIGRSLRHVKRSSQGGVGAPVLHCSTFRQLISTINLFRLSINFQTFQFFLLILQISTSGEHSKLCFNM